MAAVATLRYRDGQAQGGGAFLVRREHLWARGVQTSSTFAARLATDKVGVATVAEAPSAREGSLPLERIAFINPTLEQSGKGVAYQCRVNLATRPCCSASVTHGDSGPRTDMLPRPATTGATGDLPQVADNAAARKALADALIRLPATTSPGGTYSRRHDEHRNLGTSRVTPNDSKPLSSTTRFASTWR